ncbi:hypothetical protein [Alloscardovia sp. HMSC034E08]|uniref:hypothetical protein n=1 Tax=Alloscardovia sp. HMSC034E08 TaxID=1739413 RepID=UPI0008C3790F|nr:hypothetical protein [Alloscardovia sp. HMSC034E08]OFQ99329.1 hypothetical protein HMPREF2909_07145 [Alloscardovia sp. HMSC034E08]
MDLALMIGSAVLGLILGLLFGAFPLRTTEMTRKQESYGFALGVVCLGIVLILIFLNQNLASWIFIAAVIIGFAVAKIPPVHAWFVGRFKIFRPKKKRKK